MSYLGEPVEEVGDFEGFRKRIARFGLDAHAETLERIIRASIRFTLQPTALEEISQRSTYFGGSPDLPADLEWPHWNGAPLTFIAQFDLAEMARLMSLPTVSMGLLSIFYEAIAQPWGFRPTDANSCAIFWTPPNIPTERRRRPSYPGEIESGTARAREYAAAELRPCRAIARIALTLPHAEHPALRPLVDEHTSMHWPNSPTENAYFSLRRSLGSYGQTQLFGYPGEIQNSLEPECEYVSRGGAGWGEGTRIITNWDFIGQPEFTTRAFDWQPILCVGPDDEANLDVMWALSGAVYIMNRFSDTQHLKFDHPWAIVHGT